MKKNLFNNQILWFEKMLKSTGFVDFSGPPSSFNILWFFLCVYGGEKERKSLEKKENLLESKDKRNCEFFFLREEGIVREQGAEAAHP